MRDIKFRAWKHVNTPEMFNDVQAIEFKSGVAYLGYRLSSSTVRTDEEQLDNLILMQYTGLKDKNGSEIYEGDIVNYKNTFIDPMTGRGKLSVDVNREVVYKNGAFRMKINHSDTSSFFDSEKMEVIGDIYRNPELLKEQSK